MQTNPAGEIVFVAPAYRLSPDESELVDQALLEGPLRKIEMGGEVSIMVAGVTVYREGSPGELVAIGPDHSGKFVVSQHYTIELDGKARKYNTVTQGLGETRPG